MQNFRHPSTLGGRNISSCYSTAPSGGKSSAQNTLTFLKDCGQGPASHSAFSFSSLITSDLMKLCEIIGQHMLCQKKNEWCKGKICFGGEGWGGWEEGPWKDVSKDAHKVIFAYLINLIWCLKSILIFWYCSSIPLLYIEHLKYSYWIVPTLYTINWGWLVPARPLVCSKLVTN